MVRVRVLSRLTRLDDWAHRKTGWRDVFLYLVVYGIYEMARYISIPGYRHAVTNAKRVAGAESALGINIEHQIQAAFSSAPWPQMFNYLYLAAQEFVIPLTLLFLFWRAPRKLYRRFRDTVLFTWLLAIPVYMLFPTAPPRLAHMGFVDTVSKYSVVPIDSRMTTSLFDPYASMPSLHAGLALATSVALFFAFRNRVAKVVAASWGPVMCLVVLATGNHFILDVVAGAGCTLLGALVALTVEFGVGELRARAKAWMPIGWELGLSSFNAATTSVDNLRRTAKEAVAAGAVKQPRLLPETLGPPPTRKR